MATNGAQLSPQLCQQRAEECSALARQTDIQAVRVMLEHIATTWDRVAEKLADPDQPPKDVLGIEGEAGYMRLTGQAFDPNTIAGTQTTLDVLGSAKVGDQYGMVTGRLGYAWDRTLIYVKGGVAFLPTRSAVVDACQNTTIGCGNWLVSTAGSNTVTTWTLGGGIEWAFAPSWSVKVQYMFIALGDDGGFQTCGPVTNPSGGTVANGPFCFNHSFSGIHTAKVGLNYRFGGARY